MNEEELEKLTKKEYSRIQTATWDLSVLTTPPQFIFDYDKIKYQEPDDVIRFFELYPDDELYFGSDGYLYHNNSGYPAKILRLKNIADDIHRIVDSQEMQTYLQNVVDGKKVRLTPSDWNLYQLEIGSNDKNNTDYVNACYVIPGENTYRMSVVVSKAKDNPLFNISVYITEQPEILHFDGEDHFNYKVHLELVTGTVQDQIRPKMTRTPSVKMILFYE